jgi:hypothetical protein
MDCPACHAPNPDDSRFCNRCGNLLAMPAANAPPARPPAMPRAAPSIAHAPPAYAPPPYAPPAYAPPPYAPPPYAPPAYASAGPAPAAYAAPGASAMPAASPDATGLIQRILNITLKPKAEWPVIAAEPPSMARIVAGCVVPLAALQALLSFVHMAVIGVSIPFAGTMRMPVASSLTAAVMGFVFALIGMFVLALIVNVWAPFFAGRRSMAEALKVAAYAAVPGWLGSFFVVVPFGTLIGLLGGLYAIYVLYLGLPIVMRAPKERALGYTVAVILTGLLMGIVLGALSMAFGGFTRFGMPARNAEAQAEQGGAITGNIIGNMLGTDDKGKAALGQALGNLARAGQQMQNANPAPVAPALSPAEAAARAQQEAAQTGNVIGGMLGTDQQGRSALGQALGNLVRTDPQAQSTGATTNGNATTAPAPGGSTDPGANAGAAVGSLLTALGGALGGSHRFTPVDFRTLQGLLPDSVNGMPRGAPEGENREAMGVKASSASASYAGPGGHIRIKISDVSGVSGLIDIAGNMEHTTDAQTATGFERDTAINGRSVHEKFTSAGRQGELQVIVAKRFEVDVDGSGVEMAVLEQALGQVDLARLESMRNIGAQN